MSSCIVSKISHVVFSYLMGFKTLPCTALRNLKLGRVSRRIEPNVEINDSMEKHPKFQFDPSWFRIILVELEKHQQKLQLYVVATTF
ncbi:hypothetical protein OIU79_022499 [Salix purpurea]|uniref:Uncharacterized protein n=1 Tax=Salix purpurea TaxID=77065 RepID=A0A9Q1ACZ4_SALPP|nr:hypothetical protein OIU79_022499 [Salix purpurea]